VTLCTLCLQRLTLSLISSCCIGDLHPGNVFVSPDGTKFILFDVGIVNEYHDNDHDIIVAVLTAFIRKKGRDAGRLMIDDSNRRLASSGDRAREEEKYIDKIEALTIKASTKGYLMERLGTYISYICDAAATHHVMMNEAFISAALAVKIEEGIALAMDPTVSIPSIGTNKFYAVVADFKNLSCRLTKLLSAFLSQPIAIPIIAKSEQRKLAKTASDFLSLEHIKFMIFGAESNGKEST
jgi:predicted unusual protein kinase regulating ubiquinone biosynthesis (AarF/ABC1/UbiB family)